MHTELKQQLRDKQDEKRELQQGSDLVLCPSCNHSNESLSKFCEECGTQLRQQICPKCNVSVHSNADICEICGEWLLIGQCKFCYALLEDNTGYCGECGNPVAGIICKKCSKISFFDFCGNCGTALSESAQAALADITSKPEVHDIVQLLGEITANDLQTEAGPPTAVEEDESVKLKAYLDAVDDASPAYKPRKDRTKEFFSASQLEQMDAVSVAIAESKESKRRAIEEKLRLEAEQLIELKKSRRECIIKLSNIFDKMARIRFSSNQEARKYFMSILGAIPSELKRSINIEWQCYAYGCNHGSPSECAAPEKGGRWVVS